MLCWEKGVCCYGEFQQKTPPEVKVENQVLKFKATICGWFFVISLFEFMRLKFYNFDFRGTTERALIHLVPLLSEAPLSLP
jgi:hypothetical protein